MRRGEVGGLGRTGPGPARSPSPASILTPGGPGGSSPGIPITQLKGWRFSALVGMNASLMELPFAFLTALGTGPLSTVTEMDPN